MRRLDVVVTMASVAGGSVLVARRRELAMQAERKELSLVSVQTRVEATDEGRIAMTCPAQLVDARVTGSRTKLSWRTVRSHGGIPRVSTVTTHAPDPVVGVHAPLELQSRCLQLRFGDGLVARTTGVGVELETWGAVVRTHPRAPRLGNRARIWSARARRRQRLRHRHPRHRQGQSQREDTEPTRVVHERSAEPPPREQQ